MDITTIKKASTLSSMTVTLLLVFAFFTGMYLYWNQNATNVGLTIEGKYVDTYGNLTLAQNDLSTNVEDIKNSLNEIKEADSTFQVAWNGLKGLGNTLRLPISFVSTSLATYTGLEFALDFVPKWIRTLAFIGIIAIVVFLIASILKGDPRL